jgi:hypothetical protein
LLDAPATQTAAARSDAVHQNEAVDIIVLSLNFELMFPHRSFRLLFDLVSVEHDPAYVSRQELVPTVRGLLLLTTDSKDSFEILHIQKMNDEPFSPLAPSNTLCFSLATEVTASFNKI